MTPVKIHDSYQRSASEIPYRDRSTLRRHLLGGVICFVITAATFAVVTSTTLPRRGRDLKPVEIVAALTVVALSSGTGFGFFMGRPLRGIAIGFTCLTIWLALGVHATPLLVFSVVVASLMLAVRILTRL